MKKKLSMLSLLGGIAILFVGAVILSSCEGPAGANGTNGTNGADANSTCILCHCDDQVIVTKSKQYHYSAHNTGHTSGYTNRSFGPDYNCASCHTSQGFLDNLVGASNVPYSDVTQPNCYTCHSIHDTYTEADWGLTHPDATDPMTGSTAVDLGNGNQCTQCHRFVEHYLAIDSLFAGFDAGVMYPSDAANGNGYLMQSGVFTTDLTAATVNYNAIREDKSIGFHNSGYIEAVLMNTIEAIQ
jgi:hypothetical protein